jgi:hypothetical protein
MPYVSLSAVPSAKSYEIVTRIIAQPIARLDVMDLKTLSSHDC